MSQREEKSFSNLPLLYGKFALSQLEKGQGLTVANSLRRVLLYEIPSIGVSSVLIRQVTDSDNQNTKVSAHEFSTLPGVQESVMEVLQNLKSIVFRNSFPYRESQKAFLFLDATNFTSGQIRAKDLQLPAGIELIFPDQYIAGLTAHRQNSHAIFCLECLIEKIHRHGANEINPQGSFEDSSGAEMSQQARQQLNLQRALFPVKKVNYTIENDTFGKELVFLEIWTDGSSSPREVLDDGLEKLINLFQKFQSYSPSRETILSQHE